MKKFLLSLAMFACTIAAMATDGVTAKVSGTTLNIGLTNESEYVAFQMDITLPVAVTNVEAVAARLSQEGADGEVGSPKFIVAYNCIDEANHVYRVIAYNLKNAAISGNSGDDILTITLGAAVPDPTQITVSNVKFVTPEMVEAAMENIVAEQGGVAGDVDGNGVVELDDVVKTLNIFLKKEADNGLADIDGNGVVELDDVVLCLNIFLKKF